MRSLCSTFFILVSILFVWSTYITNVYGVSSSVEVNQVNEATENALQRTLNTYILDVYKAQWDKILQDLDANLEKIAPLKATKIEAYTSIQKALSARLNTITEDDSIGANARTILIKYLDYMIKSIQARKKLLE